MSNDEDDFMSEESYEFEFEDDDDDVDAHSHHLQEQGTDHSVVRIRKTGGNLIQTQQHTNNVN